MLGIVFDLCLHMLGAPSISGLCGSSSPIWEMLAVRTVLFFLDCLRRASLFPVWDDDVEDREPAGGCAGDAVELGKVKGDCGTGTLVSAPVLGVCKKREGGDMAVRGRRKTFKALWKKRKINKHKQTKHHHSPQTKQPCDMIRHRPLRISTQLPKIGQRSESLIFK